MLIALLKVGRLEMKFRKMNLAALLLVVGLSAGTLSGCGKTLPGKPVLRQRISRQRIGRQRMGRQGMTRQSAPGQETPEARRQAAGWM